MNGDEESPLNVFFIMAAKQGDYRGEGNSFTSSVAFVRLESAL